MADRIAVITGAGSGIGRASALELMNDGWGFLRRDNYQPSPDDVYVSQSLVKRNNLRAGDQR